MSFLSAIPISRKLPAIVLALCLSSSLSIALVGYFDFQRNMMNETRKSFGILAEARGDALQSWLSGLEDGVLALGTDPTAVSAINMFSTSYNLMIDSAGLQAAYITNNTHPDGEKDLLDQAPESVPYHFQHGQFHPYFRQIKDAVGYYDIFLFNLEGDVMYSVFKEADYATNILSGPYRNSGLSDAFRQAVAGTSGQSYFADFAPYAPSGNAAASFLASQVVDTNGTTIGIVAIQVPVGQLDAIMNNPRGLGDSGVMYVVGENLQTRSRSRFEGGYGALHDVSGLMQAVTSLDENPEYNAKTTGINGAEVLSKATHFDLFGKHWGIVGEIDLAEVNIPVVAVRNKMIFLTLGIGALCTLLGWLTARSFIVPLNKLGKAMNHVAEQDYETRADNADRGDEIGKLSRILAQLRDRLAASDLAETERRAQQAEQAQVVGRLSKALTQLADGDLTHQITTPFTGEYDQLRQDYNRTMVTLNDTLGSVVGRAADIRARSQDMSTSSDDLSRRTENQAATLEETAAALDELTASVKSAAEGARKVENIVSDARSDAQESEPVVQSAVTAMNEIEASSEEISKIIGVIDDIAFQTNLLALNAGVEAARAGEAGRGFAVVASEVRALAQRSSDAAKQIKTLISESAGQVSRGVDLVGQAGSVLTKIADHINHISGLVTNIASGVEEQSVGLGEINIGVTQLDKVTQQNAAMVEKATTNSHGLSGTAGDLADMMKRFKLREGLGSVNQGSDNIDTFEPKMVQSHPSPARTATPAPRGSAYGQTAQKRQNDPWQDF